ncbi:MAG: YqhA family protein [Candidatus Nitrospinota bacterium M3_3B_026]
MFEKFLWNSRFVVILAVLASLVSSVILFIIATADVFTVAKESVSYGLGIGAAGAMGYDEFHGAVVGHIIGSVDDFLLATVLLIFAFGLYELFISEIEEAQSDERKSRILIISSLDDLKDRLAKVVLMILIVTFFKNVIHTEFTDPLSLLYLGGGIFLVALALYLTHVKGGGEGGK